MTTVTESTTIGDALASVYAALNWHAHQAEAWSVFGEDGAERDEAIREHEDAVSRLAGAIVSLDSMTNASLALDRAHHRADQRVNGS